MFIAFLSNLLWKESILLFMVDVMVHVSELYRKMLATMESKSFSFRFLFTFLLCHIS